MTLRALEHAYEAFQKAGNEPQATKTLSELKARFPNYTLKVSNAGLARTVGLTAKRLQILAQGFSP